MAKWFICFADTRTAYLLHDKQEHKWEIESQRGNPQKEFKGHGPDQNGAGAEPRADLRPHPPVCKSGSTGVSSQLSGLTGSLTLCSWKAGRPGCLSGWPGRSSAGSEAVLLSVCLPRASVGSTREPFSTCLDSQPRARVCLMHLSLLCKQASVTSRENTESGAPIYIIRPLIF